MVANQERINNVLSILEKLTDAGTAKKLADTYTDAFSANYWNEVPDEEIAKDMVRVADLQNSDVEVGLRFVTSKQDIASLCARIYHKDTVLPLSDSMPILERMGFRIMAEEPFKISPASGNPIYLHRFHVDAKSGKDVDADAIADAVEQTFLDVFTNEAENDDLNSLVVDGGLSSRQIVMLRSIAAYLHQIKAPFPKGAIAQAFALNPDAVAMLLSYFEARFDPAFSGKRDSATEKIAEDIRIYLEGVSSLQHDSIIRRYFNVMQNTLRTNFYQKDADGNDKARVALKIATREIIEVPKPAPLREIFVYSPRFEAVHLRFGFVARGGLRWSDRRADFRTEILGLVKAQQVKNSVIVPVGSKGGFVLKQAPADREGFMEEGVTCYKQFINSLLDVTDNLSGDKIIAPEQVVRNDDDDPYLVVAADKGTATFSDFANGVSRDAGFWLDDAFASGGSNGYDHKAMGITARGGWESVKRHFREMGINTQAEEFSVIGVGDMSGDVFGNGMLLSEFICLKAAFNHLHIFVDPNPTNPKACHAERKRLFEMPRSSWTDYNQDLISKGGGIFERSAKSIDISPEMKKSFGISEDKLTPNELLKAILKSQVDLLWFGGIGTYLRSTTESDGSVGDPGNDAIRITSKECNAKVIGEGANLGVTHLARIEYAQKGGRCNTDAIDNSAGVDCSDHEVNIKILLSAVQQKTGMSEDDRNTLLETMTDEVGEQCLRDNYLQTQCITAMVARGYAMIENQKRLMHDLEHTGELERALEYLPTDEELTDRMRHKESLTRPELSVLLAYAKNVSYQDILASDLPDDASLEHWLIDYFPTPLRDKYSAEIKNHRLRREIIATAITNDMFNRTRASFVSDMQHRTGMSTADIARAYLITCSVFGLRKIWGEVEALDNIVSADVQTDLLAQTTRLVERMTEWFLRNDEELKDMQATIKRYGAGVDVMSDKIESLLGAIMHADLQQRRKRFGGDNIPASVTESVAAMKVISAVADIVRLATVHNQDVLTTAKTYYACGQRFQLGKLRSRGNKMQGNSTWERMAIASAIDDLWSLQATLAHWAIRDTGGDIEKFLEAHEGLTAHIDQLLSDVSIEETFDLSMLVVVSREIRSLVS